MPDGDRVGSAYVDIHVNAGPGEAELAAFKAKVDRDFDELGRKKAEGEFKLKTADFDKEIDKVKTELDNLKRKKASVTIKADTKELDADIAEAEAELDSLTKKKRTIQIDSRQVKAANDAERLLAKGRALDEKQAIQSAKAERSLSNERQKTVDRGIKERAELAKLSSEYEKLAGKQLALKKSSSGIFSPRSISTADSEARKLERVGSEMDLVKHKIESLGGTVEGLDPAIRKNSSTLDRWISKLGDTSVRMGPITTSIKGLATGLGLLGPLVFELGGGVTALAGTVGTGLAGAFTVGAGAAAGFAASALGVGLILKPMIGEFKEVHSATTALAKAQLKYGKDSTQAKTATEQLNHELHGVSPIAKEGIQAWGGLSSKWKELTKGARPAVFNAFGESLKTVQSLLPAFASESVKTTKVAGKAWDGWMKSLRSNEAKGLLKGVMGDFRASIPGLASGLGSLVAMMGRLSAAGAHFLPGLSNGFADWANNLERSVGGGQKLTGEVGGMVSQMKDLGHLTQDTGSLLVHIFSAGSTSGQGMVKSLDQVIKRWNKWTQSAKGKSGLTEFFDESKGATENFMSSLSHMTKLLFEFSRATAPVANGLLQIVTWIGDIVSAADNLVGVKQIFQGIGLVLGGLFVASKVAAYGDALAGVAARFGLISAATDADVASTEALTAATVELTAALTAEAAAATDADVALGAGAAGATRAALGLDGATESAGLLSAALAPEVLIPAAGIAAAGLLASQIGGVGNAWVEATEDVQHSKNVIPEALKGATHETERYVTAANAQHAATNNVATARERLAKLEKENAPLKQRTKAVTALNEAERAQAATTRTVGKENTQSVRSAKAVLESAKERIKAAKAEKAATLVSTGGHRGMGLTHQDERDAEIAAKKAQANRDLASAEHEAAQAANELAVKSIPLQREQENLAPITQQTQEGLEKLSKTIGTAATKKIGKFVNPGDVKEVTNLSNHLDNLGRGPQVKNVAVKSQGADQTIAKLQQLNKQTQKVEGTRATLKVGANDTSASQKLKKLAATSQRLTGSKNTINILANSSNAEQAINRLRAHLTSFAHQKYEAIMSAADRTSGPRDSAYHHAREFASQKYEAILNARDSASAVAKKAESAAKAAGRQHPNIPITATNQASGTIQQVIQEIRSIPPSAKSVITTEHVNVIRTEHKGNAAGAGGSPVMGFAGGGDRAPSAYVMQRAGERATPDTRGRSRRVQTPKFLVGEETGHPEYVIATNPAYRDSNERYLASAADDLGYEVIPAHATGSGGKKKKKKAASGGSGSSGPGSGPHGHPGHQHNSHFYLKHNKFSSQATEEYNTEERDVGLKENLYNKEVEREEKEIEHGTLEEWNWPLLRGYITDERNDYRKIGSLTKTIRGDTNEAISKAQKRLKSINGPIKSTRHEVSHLSGEYSALTAPTKGKKTEAEYTQAKKHYAAEKRNKKAEVKAAERKLKKLEKEKENALTIEREAKEKLHEIGEHSGSIFEKENTIHEEEAQTNLTYFEGELEERTAGTPSTEPSLAEQTATLSAEREKLYNEFGSNIGIYEGAAAGTSSPAAAAVSKYGPSGGSTTYGSPAAAAAQKAATTGPGGYVTAATRGAAGNGLPTNVLSGGGGAGGSDGTTGTVNNVTNNFAAPPPDPHTWVKQQQFSLQAVAA